MLKFFEVERTYNKLTVRLYVEPDHRDPKADLTVTYDRRIVRMGAVPNHALRDVLTPEGAERWLSRDTGERGSWIEATEHSYRTSA